MCWQSTLTSKVNSRNTAVLRIPSPSIQTNSSFDACNEQYRDSKTAIPYKILNPAACSQEKYLSCYSSHCHLKLTRLSTEQLCVAFAAPQCIKSEQPKPELSTWVKMAKLLYSNLQHACTVFQLTGKLITRVAGCKTDMPKAFSTSCMLVPPGPVH